jgi:hypothetical protein
MHKYTFISILLMDGKYPAPFLAHVWRCQECSRNVRTIERSRLNSAQNDRTDKLVLDGIQGICPSTNLLMLYRGDWDGLVKDEYLLDYYQKLVVQRHIDVCPECQQTLKLFTLIN